MIKIDIEYEDFNGEKQTEPFWFHLSQAEIVEWHLTYEGNGEDLETYMKRIVKTTDKPALIGLFKGLITRTVGRRSEDGRRFEKSDEITKDFMQTNAYSEFFMRLVTDAEYAAEYFNGTMPKEIVTKAFAEADKPVEDTRPLWEKEDRNPTKKELIEMSPEEMKAAFVKRASL